MNLRLFVPLLLAAGCRGSGDIDSMLGTWEGTLDCVSDVDAGGQTVRLEYSIDLLLILDEQDEKRYSGTLDTFAAYLWDAREIREETAYSVGLLQARPQGDQPVELRDAACAAYAVYVDDESAGGVCDAADARDNEPVASEPPSGELRWDGADTITVTGEFCDGTILR
jgi:hypothetical protein